MEVRQLETGIYLHLLRIAKDFSWEIEISKGLMGYETGWIAV